MYRASFLLTATTRLRLIHRQMSTAAKAPFILYTEGTPNGKKISVYLEELKSIYGDKVAYDVEHIALRTGKQKEPWFIDTLNPNGKIPVLVDRNRPSTTGAEGFAVFETAAILLYLSQHYDPEHKLWFDVAKQPEDYSEMLQWIFFAHGGVGPMQGQSNHFNKYAPEDIPYAKKRYLEETKRLYGVLEIRLRNRDWLAGPGTGVYSIADINVFPWIRGHKFAGIESIDEFPRLKAWFDRIEARPTVQAGLAVPKSQ